MLPTVISYDKENDPEALALIASSAALAISGIPFMGPVAAAKVGIIDGEFVLNPTKEQITRFTVRISCCWYRRCSFDG